MILISVTPIPTMGLYELNQSIIIDRVHIPRGFRWDGASIPFALWSIIGSPFRPEYMVPSMVHDYLYTHGYSMGISRKRSDKIFRKLLLVQGVSESGAQTLYDGVRIGGGSHYSRD